MFWQSTLNIVDVLLTGLCVLTLGYLIVGDCSDAQAREAIADTLLLTVRNGMQLARVISVM